MNDYEIKHYKSCIDINNLNESRSIIYSFINENTTVLDLGCACGDLGIILQNKNCTVYGLEYLQECVDIARGTNAYVEVSQCDLDNFDIEKFQQYKNLFDYIVLGDVLEHLYNPDNLLMKLKKFLKDDGHIIISIPNISHASVKISILLNQFNYSDYGTLDKTHLRFFTLSSFTNLLKKLNYNIVSFNYTVQGLKGSMNDLKYNAIPKEVLWFILNDNESICFQYIFKISKQNNNKTNLSKNIIKKAVNYKLLKKIKQSNFLKMFKF